MTIAVFTLSLLGAMALGMPIAFALIVCGVALMYQLDIFDSQIVAQNIINGADSFPLMAVPFFMLAGEVMNTGGLSRRIVNVALAFVGHVRGGLGYVAIMAACILSALSGSAVADAAALSALLIPMMTKAGHNKATSGGSHRRGRHHRPGHSAQHRFRDLRRGRRRLDHEAVPCRHRSGTPDRDFVVLCMVVAGAQGGHRLAAATDLARIGARRRRRRLGIGPALHHRVRPEIRLLHADRSRGRRRRLFAVRRDVHLSRAESLAALSAYSSPPR